MRYRIPTSILLVTCLFTGCASAGIFSGLFTAKVADKAQVAENITGIGKVDTKVADTVKADAQIGSRTSTSTKTSSGRDTTVTNDSALMERYISSIQEGNRQNTRLYRYVIGGLLFQISGLVGLLGWALKKALNSNADDDRFKEKLLEDKTRRTV